MSTAPTMLLRAVSLPIESSEPGRLLLIEAGRQTIGRLKAGKRSRSACSLAIADVARPAADHQDPVDLVLLDVAGDLVELAVGGLAAVRAELGPAAARPAVDAHPAHLEEVALHEALEAVAHAQHVVAAVEGEAQRGADGGVHARGGPAAVHDREAEALLPLDRRVGKGAHDRAQGPQGRAEAAARAAPSPPRSRRSSRTRRPCGSASTHCMSGWRVTRLSFIPMSWGSLPGGEESSSSTAAWPSSVLM